MPQASIQRTSSRSERATTSSLPQSRRTREWRSDEDYIADQDRECSWSHETEWGRCAAYKFIKYGQYLGERLCHDDVVADFGGNDGYVAHEFYRALKIRPIVVDCQPSRLDYADKVYKFSTCESFLESMPFRDKQIDWGFCSHTLEHCRDVAAALAEIRRVVRRGCFFVVPLEDKRHAHKNHAHAVCFRKLKQWTTIMREAGWKLVGAEKVSEYEAQIVAEPE